MRLVSQEEARRIAVHAQLLDGSATLLLDTVRLHEVLHLVSDLRRAGKNRGLIDEVHRRLSDQSLLDRSDLASSLDEMRSGKGRVVRSV